MKSSTKELVLAWLGHHYGDKERLARWMRDTLRLGGVRECRALIEQALS